MIQFLYLFNQIILNDAAEPWQLGFQDSAAPGFTGLVTLHNNVAFYLILITISVFWVLFSIIYYYNSKNNPIAHKYLTHGSIIELIWTITPALILIAIAFPSFRLLYIMDFWEVNNFNIINYFLWISSTAAFSVFSSCAAGVPLSIVGTLFKGAKCRRSGDFLTGNFFINKIASHKNISSKSILNIKAESTKIVVFNSLNIPSTLGIRLTQFNRNNSYFFF